MGGLNYNRMEETNNDYINFLKKQFHDIIFNLEIIDKAITEKGLQHEQFILDFYDKLNEISVRK